VALLHHHKRDGRAVAGGGARRRPLALQRVAGLQRGRGRGKWAPRPAALAACSALQGTEAPGRCAAGRAWREGPDAGAGGRRPECGPPPAPPAAPAQRPLPAAGPCTRPPSRP
jgi:hypothetical protein